MYSQAKPGEKYSYSSTNYLLLAMIMDKVLGRSHQTYYVDRILKYLNLENTFYRQKPDSMFSQHYGGLSDPSMLENITLQMIETTNWFMGDDGVYSTAREAGIFMEALNKGKIVNEQSWNIEK